MSLFHVFGDEGSSDVPVGSVRVRARRWDPAERAESWGTQEEVVSQTDAAGAEPVQCHRLEQGQRNRELNVHINRQKCNFGECGNSSLANVIPTYNTRRNHGYNIYLEDILIKEKKSKDESEIIVLSVSM